MTMVGFVCCARTIRVWHCLYSPSYIDTSGARYVTFFFPRYLSLLEGGKRHKRRCRQSYEERLFTRDIIDLDFDDEAMKSRYSQPRSARVPATADRGHQVVQQLQEQQARAGGCAYLVPVERSRGCAQEDKLQFPGVSRLFPSVMGSLVDADSLFQPSIVRQRRV